IGAQEVKNIPTPVHAYMVAMRREDGTYSTPQVKKPAGKAPSAAPNWMWPLVVGVVSIVAIGVAGFLYFTKLELSPGVKAAVTAEKAAVPAPAPSPSPSLAASAPVPPPPGPPPIPSAEKLVAENVPFIGGRARANLANEYMQGADHKAFALTVGGTPGFV